MNDVLEVNHYFCTLIGNTIPSQKVKLTLQVNHKSGGGCPESVLLTCADVSKLNKGCTYSALYVNKSWGILNFNTTAITANKYKNSLNMKKGTRACPCKV